MIGTDYYNTAVLVEQHDEEGTKSTHIAEFFTLKSVRPTID